MFAGLQEYALVYAVLAGILLMVGGIGYEFGRFHQANFDRRHAGRQLERIMGDVSRLNGSLTALSEAIARLIAAQGASDQAAIDAAQQQVDGLTAQVVAATPAPPQ